MRDYDVIANFMLIACALGAVIAIRYQFVRRDYRKPNASAQRAGTTPPSRPDHFRPIWRFHNFPDEKIGASYLQRPTTRQREPRPTGLRPGSHP